MCTTFAPGAQEAQKNQQPPGIEVTHAYNNPHALWITNADPLQEQELYLTTEVIIQLEQSKFLKVRKN